MKLSENIKPTGYLKDHVEEIVHGLGESPETFVITQDGRPKAILQDIGSFERTQETLKLLKILAIGRQQADAGKVRPAMDVIAEMRRRLEEKNDM